MTPAVTAPGFMPAVTVTPSSCNSWSYARLFGTVHVYVVFRKFTSLLFIKNRDLPPGFVRRWLGRAVLIVADGTRSDNQRTQRPDELA